MNSYLGQLTRKCHMAESKITRSYMNDRLIQDYLCRPHKNYVRILTVSGPMWRCPASTQENKERTNLKTQSVQGEGTIDRRCLKNLGSPSILLVETWFVREKRAKILRSRVSNLILQDKVICKNSS